MDNKKNEILDNGETLGQSQNTTWETVKDIPFAGEEPVEKRQEEQLLSNYNKKRDAKLRILEKQKATLRKHEEKIQRLELEKGDPNIERRIATEEIRIRITKDSISKIESELKFMREPSSADINYRMRQYKEFATKVRDALPKDSTLCFHGTPIDGAEAIIASRQISSSVNRLGYATSYDVEDQISVTTKETLETTVQGYSGLEDSSMPAGCIFVVTPRDENEIESSSRLLMGNIDFEKNPERLKAIITTPENIERISGWLEGTGLSPDCVCDYDNFVEKCKAENTLANS